MTISVPGWYYAQHGADHTLPHPGEGFGGWQRAELPIDPAHTAIVVMHAWANPPIEEVPALWSRVEYLKRADMILQERFPGFLEKVRASKVRLIHIGSGSEQSLEALPGYQRTKAAFPPEPPPERMALDENARELLAFRVKNVLSAHDTPENRRVYERRDFAVMPLDEEDVACTTSQLFGLCRQYGISHLIYTGFAVNACLAMSPCGFIDMSRRGLLCSIVSDLTTAVENRESAAAQSNLAYGLWAFGIWGGFRFEQADLENTLLKG